MFLFVFQTDLALGKFVWWKKKTYECLTGLSKPLFYVIFQFVKYEYIRVSVEEKGKLRTKYFCSTFREHIPDVGAASEITFFMSTKLMVKTPRPTKRCLLLLITIAVIKFLIWPLNVSYFVR